MALVHKAPACVASDIRMYLAYTLKSNSQFVRNGMETQNRNKYAKREFFLSILNKILEILKINFILTVVLKYLSFTYFVFEHYFCESFFTIYYGTHFTS